MVRKTSEYIWWMYFLFVLTIASSIKTTHGCQMDGVIMWPIPVSESILDTHAGYVLDRGTTDIEDITTIRYGEGLNAGPYLEVSHAQNRFQMWVNDAYRNYEENEVAQSMSMTVTFRCTGGTTNTLVFLINVIDTNNNAPQFRPNDIFEYVITTPLAPGFLVTGCFNNIVVRDIDLTTQRIDFGIEENPYIDIAYDSSLSTTPKEFKAVLRTKTFIRTIPELLTLQISATDVDLTGDPPRTTYATVHIKSDPEFEFPEEPVFSRAFYLANYDEGKITHDAISLRQGFDDQVQFSLDGDYATNFQLNQNGNQITLSVRTPLSNIDVSQILLIVKAEREYTSGASATVIVQLPEEVNLEFERAHYSGQIENNILRLSQLTLIQGFEGSISARIIGEHASYFSVTVQGNSVTITMAPLTENIIRDNNFIYLEVIVSAERGLGSAVVTLEIIKDDNTTPVFSSRIYTGNYDVVNGLNIEPIYFVQGYDDSVSLKLDGDSSELFEVERDGAIIKITSSALPVEIHSRSNLILSLEATKPRTVGANAAIVINLPEARELIFEESTYKGTLQDNILTLETIVLSVGYQDDVSFNLIGEYKDYFATSNVQNRVALSLLRQFPESVILANSLILLTLEATGQNAVTTTTNVLLEIIKEDLTTPLFSRKIYYGSYIGTQTLDIENINLVQGFDDTVTFRIEGEHSQFFAVSNIGNNVVLSLRSQIPSDVIYSEKVFSFNVIANKALTVGANAAILIRFPAELTDSAVMRFSRSTYVGSLENERLSLENIVLDTGYADDTQFELTGEYESYFTIANRENTLTVSLITPLPSQVMEANDFLVLEIEASRDRAISATTSAIIHIIRQEIIHPVFSEAYYRGVYTETRGLEIDGAISLSSGYDDTVTFKLEGESARWFTITQNNNLATVALLTSIPQSVLNENTQLLFSVVAAKPNAISGRAILSIDLPRDSSEVSVLRFAQNSYIAFLQNGVLESPNISLENSDQPANINIIGDYESYFRIIQESNVIRLTLVNDLPIDIINNNNFIVLNLEASYLNAISGYATIIIDIITDSVSKTPVFSEAYYFGEYSEQTGLVFEHTIRLIQGFDENVSFTLSGDDAQWFRLVQIGPNNHALSVVEGDLRIRDKCKLLFNVVATKAGSLDGQVAVVISLKDYTTTTMIRFTRDFYKGAIDGNTLALNAISLEGYSSEVTYSLIGDYAEYFQLNNQNGVFTLHLGSNLPDSVTSTNNVLVLTVEAQLKNLRTHTTVVLEIITKTDGSVSILKFEEAYYLGSYSNDGGLNFEHDMRVTTNLDDISFNLNGDNAQWFGLVQNQNSVSLKLKTPIPSAVIANNRKLVFTLTAQRPGSALASATVIISLVDEYTDGMSLLGFERVTYVGSIEDNTVTLDSIALTEGFSTSISFTLFGELIDFFTVTASGSIVSIGLQRTIPEDLIPANRVIVLELRASAPQAVSAYTTIVLTIARDEDSAAPVNDLVFDSPHYTGSYSEMSGLVFETPISLSQGYDTAVQFSLEGDNAQWFSLIQNQNSISLTLRTPIPTAVITNNRKLIFSVAAQRPGSITIRTTIIISLIDEPSDGMSLLGFERVTYVGSIEDNTVTLGSIALTKGFSSSISFTLFGELVDFFTVTASGSTVTIGLHRTIPEDLIPANRVIVLELRASASQAVSAYTTIVLTIARDEDSTAPVNDLVFDSPHYTGSYSEMSGLVFETPISLSQGYDAAVQFSLEGDNAQWFSLIQNQNSVSLTLRTPIPTAVIANNRKLIFSVAAQRPGSITIRTTIIISLSDEPSDGMSLLGFERVTYVGSIEDNTVALDSIALTKGFSTSVSFTLFGELVDFFTVTASGSTATIGLHRTIPEDLIPSNRFIVLELRASAPQAVSAYTTIVLTIARDEDSGAPVNDLVFDSPHYTGSYTEINGLVFDTPISLSRGYDEMVIFYLEGDNTQWFNLVKKENIISLTLAMPIPSTVLANNRKLIFNIAAQRPGSVTARATIIILLLEGEEVPSNEYFDKVLYEGLIQGNIVRHEQINLFGFLGENIRLIGEYASLFGANVNNGVITIQLSGSIPVPTDVTLIALELHALRARSVLLLTVESTENPNPPLVVFGSSSYALRVEITRTGLIGRVHASADNGEAVTYSLRTENVHLVDRLSVNNDGELHLSAPASSGVYTFEVVATTVFTRASALAIVHLTVDAATICGDDLVMPPLLVIDRDEESPHRDLVALNPEKHEGCRYTLTNRWPVDQTWLYVDDTGLHTRAIDREHESIAFMKVSQVQVELILHCANDKVRSKRSIDQKTNSVDDYGSNHWILTDSILYNSRRSFVNLIVNDINDNAPVFVGKENEPIAVGYPISDLEEVLRPRSLAELKASDADIGENAVLRYWSHEPAVVVSPTTGFVHVRSGARLQDNQELTVHATDRNGEGLTGHIKLLVKLLDVNNIAVVTVQNSFLDDEIKIISQLSTGVGYEVKALRSDIISDAAQPSDDTRKERDAGVAGTTMQLYIYGLNERQPVSVERLITDINNIAIIVDIVANAISLEDHLEGREICVIAERDTGLLIACILLSILLFIIIVVAVVWSILKRRKSPHYSQFSDKNSIASRTNSLGQLPKTEAEQKPRLYIEDLRKSERKLQEILDAPPLEEVKASTSTEKLSEPPTESIIDIPVMEPSLPIVIQSIDKLKDATDESDDDEFGENKKNRRKSVVTFNENVEKIIHVEDDDDSTSVPGYEIYKL